VKFTVIGSNGFIGSHLQQYIKNQGHECFSPDIRNQNIFGEDLGHVIYAIGVPNFLERPFDTIDSHVCILKNLLEKANFESFLYISTARFYYNCSTSNEEEDFIINPTKLDDLYNISKALGESICYSSKHENIKIVRPSNVTGNNFSSTLFIPSILRDAINKNKIKINSTLDSEKDYVWITDVVNMIIEIILKGKNKIYNISSGRNTKSEDIINEICKWTNATVEINPNATKFSSPLISNQRIKDEFGFKPTSIISKIKNMIESYREIDQHKKNS